MRHEKQLQERWADLWNQLSPGFDALRAFESLCKHYAEPGRAYHNLVHIDECLAELDAARHLAFSSGAVELAIWFHDAVYDPRKSDNEERSVYLMEAATAAANLPVEFRAAVKSLVLATKHSQTPEETDQRLIVDIDLAILGKDELKFDQYEDQIRAEYSWVPLNIFAEKRAAILAAFLRRAAIYSHQCFRERYEAPARKNLERSIEKLNHITAA
jgi:predicted metal-dependent HD superfamily phosphohydrolase